MSTITSLIIVSPHRDDAAFSCGVVLHRALAFMPVTLLNIFTRSSYAPFAPEMETAGLDAVTALRQQEDIAYFSALKDATGPFQLSEYDLRLLDAPHRLQLLTEDVQGPCLRPQQYDEQVNALSTTLRPLLSEAACVLLPLGLGGTGLDGHIDHHIARDAAMRCGPVTHVAFYEDLPYAARMDSAQRASAISAFTAALELVQPVRVLDEDAYRLKLKSAGYYPSQVAPETIEEIGRYTQDHHGEHLYAGSAAQHILESF